MKKIIFIFLIILNFLYAANAQKNTLSVSAEEYSEIMPDTVCLTFSLQKDGLTADEAQTVLKRNIDKVLEVLITECGIDKEMIKTDTYSLYPLYRKKKIEDPESEEDIDKYRAYVRITYQLSQVTQLGKTMDAIKNAGINKIEKIYFTLKNQDINNYQTLQLATKKAQTKAEIIAKELNLELLSPIAVTEHSSNVDPSLYTINSNQAATSNMSGGKITINSKVEIIYEFSKKEPAPAGDVTSENINAI